MNKWEYCPECGTEETYYFEIQENSYKHNQCENCHQEWFEDIDYNDTVRINLLELYNRRLKEKENEQI